MIIAGIGEPFDQIGSTAAVFWEREAVEKKKAQQMEFRSQTESNKYFQYYSSQ